MGAVSKVLFILIPLVFLFVVLAIFFGGDGLFGKVKEAILGAKEVLPEVSIGLEEQKAEVTIPDVHREEILNLQKAIVFLLSGKGREVARENCFANYGRFSALGEEGTSIIFESQGDNTTMIVLAGSGGKQKISDLSVEFPGMKPCVIAGKGGISENFYDHFIDEEQLIHPYYTEVNSVRIFGGGFDYNGINIPELDLQSNLEDGGVLFTPDGEHICFFPTNLIGDGIHNYGESGIDNDYFTSDEENSIPNRIKQGKLQKCS